MSVCRGFIGEFCAAIIAFIFPAVPRRPATTTATATTTTAAAFVSIVTTVIRITSHH
jgi:hypothetical protein